MFKSFHIVESGGDDGKVPTTDLFVVGIFYFSTTIFEEEF